MQVTKSMLEVFFVTDEQGEIISGPYFFESEAYEAMGDYIKQSFKGFENVNGRPHPLPINCRCEVKAVRDE